MSLTAMNNTYDPKEYWIKSGKTYWQNFQTDNVYFNQEVKLLEYLDRLNEGFDPKFERVLEVGCGFGRVTKVVTDTFTIGEYYALDISKDQLKNMSHVDLDDSDFPIHDICANFESWRTTKKFDLVLSVEFLMHMLPSKVQSIIDKMISMTVKYGHVVSLDYFYEGEQLEPHNFNHDYFALYKYNCDMMKIGKKQALFHYQKK